MKMGNSKKIIPVSEWFSEKKVEPLIIAGPCSAESEKQILDTALAIAKISKVTVFRAGVWKPRTRPGSFEGMGNKALKWLQKVQKQTGLKVAVEVATPDHVKKCLAHGIDVLWIGARTTSNPFSIQEIADSLKNCNIPVLVKNPINPDLELWVGAIERLQQVNVKKIGAIHRGFYPFEKTSLRNIPKWEVAIELKTRMPNLPILCDPSHISGNIDFIPEIAQKALDLAFDGLMLESHISPISALSDNKQQLEPKSLSVLLENLRFRNISINDHNFIDRLDTLRSKIDSIDFQLLELLLQRMNVVEELGIYKSINNVSIFQLRRWKQIIETRMDYGVKLGLNQEFIKEILQLIHDESIKKQTEVAYQKTVKKTKKK
jgi:chorismate mutase